MSAKSAIEWTDATWNPVTGCSKVSQGCKHCYAEREWPRLAAPRQKPNIYTGRAFTDVHCHPEKLDIPLRWTKPRRIFVNSMSDLFHEAVPDDFISCVWFTMAHASRHVFQVLTKRPERMLEWVSRHGLNSVRYGEREEADEQEQKMPWPLPNVWLGVSVENQETADERIPLLLDTPAAVRWVSAEPLLDPIDLQDAPNDMGEPRVNWLRGMDASPPIPRLDWVVAGGESGPKARPSHPDWFRSLRDQCQAAGVPFFFKQWGEWVPVCAQYPSTDQEHDEHEASGCVGDIAVEADGTIVEGYQPRSNRAWLMDRAGKKAAGRMLDGRTWDEYPA